MTSLEQQMVTYGEILEEEQGNLLLDEITSPRGDIIELGKYRRSRPKWLGFALGAALVVVLVGLIPFFTSQDQPPVATAPVPSTTPEPAPTNPVTTDPAPPTTEPAPTSNIAQIAESVTWTSHPGSAPLADRVLLTPTGLAAIHTEDFQAPLVYMTSNGLDWSVVAIPAPARVLTEFSHDLEIDPTPVGIWLTGPEGGLWFTDLESWASGEPSWEETASDADLIELKGPAPFGSRWAPGISGKARIGNTSLLAVEWELVIDYAAILDVPAGYTDIHHDDLDSCFSSGATGQLSVRARDSSGEDVCLTRVTMVNEAGGVIVLDESGGQVLIVENAVAEFDYGSGGPHISPASGMLDLYSSTGGQLKTVPSVDDSRIGCSHGLDQSVDAVVYSIDCQNPTSNRALSTGDGTTWEAVPFEADKAALGDRHPLGFFWKSTWPWGPPDDIGGPSTILVSPDDETWTDLNVSHALVFEMSAGLVITFIGDDGLADEIGIYDGVALTTVDVVWPIDEWPGFLGAIGDDLILIDGGGIWVGETFSG